MVNNFNILRITRNNILNAIQDLSVNQFNKIPEGYNNNIIWNVGHILITAQILVYKLSGTDTHVSNEMIEEFRKGTMPKENYTQEDIDEIKSLMITTIDMLEKDYQLNHFNDYQEYTTSYNITLRSTEDAIIFNNVHEALHLGYIMALKKVI